MRLVERCAVGQVSVKLLAHVGCESEAAMEEVALAAFAPLIRMAGDWYEVSSAAFEYPLVSPRLLG